MEKKVQANSLEKGQYLSETQYYQIQRVDIASIVVKNERDFEFTVSKRIVEEGMYSASQYDQEVEVTRTELIEIFRTVGDTVFTVNFNKMPTADVINIAIEGLNKGKILPIKEMKAKVKEAFKGEERTLIGYLVKTETGFGRSMVIDLEQQRGDKPDYDQRLRQVDHRTLNWLIHKNIKYKVRK